MLETGAVLENKYRLERAAGGGGTVFLATRLADDHGVTVRVLGAEAADLVARVAKIDHPSVIKIHDHWQANELMYVVTERLSGELLSKVIERGPLSDAQACAIALAICAGLEASAAAGISHPDLAPTQVMLDGRDSVTLFTLGAVAGSPTPTFEALGGILSAMVGADVAPELEVVIAQCRERNGYASFEDVAADLRAAARFVEFGASPPILFDEEGEEQSEEELAPRPPTIWLIAAAVVAVAVVLGLVLALS